MQREPQQETALIHHAEEHREFPAACTFPKHHVAVHPPMLSFPARRELITHSGNSGAAGSNVYLLLTGCVTSKIFL